MRDGLYKVEFRTPIGAGAGVIVLSGGKLVGGDSSLYYVGTYAQQGDQFTAEVRTARHFQGLDSVFGKDNVTIHLRGEAKGDAAVVQGSSPDAPGLGFQAHISRLAD